MYEQHFGLSRPLFPDGMAQDEAVFRTAAVAQLVSDLEIALTRKDSVAVISGTSGTGKSTIATDALKNINTRLAFSCISHAPLTAHELLEQLLTDFGFEPYRLSRVERLQLWRQFLSEMAATDTRVCLLVENADGWSPGVLRYLHDLTAADAALSPGANIILTTVQAPERVLTTEEMLAFNQRVRLRRRLDPLTESETGDFLAFACRRAGVAAADLFDDHVAGSLYELSGGVVRVIENLLESALNSAAAAGERLVTTERLEETAESQFGIARLEPEAVEELLVESTSREARPFADIPTLTDFVGIIGEDDTAARLSRVRAASTQH
jgi:general secretion pathway protein A